VTIPPGENSGLVCESGRGTDFFPRQGNLPARQTALDFGGHPSIDPVRARALSRVFQGRRQK